MAQKLKREWIGIDVTHLSIALQKYRLKDTFGLEPVGTKTTRAKSEPPALAGGKEANTPSTSIDTEVDSTAKSMPPAYADGSDKKSSPPYEGGVAAASADGVVLSFAPDQTSVSADLENHPPAKAVPLLRKEGSLGATYRIIGEPEDLDGARQLTTEDRYQFQWWALSLIKARPLGGSAGSKEGKKGSDKGIDGTTAFVNDNSGKAKRVIVQVKSGHVGARDIHDLHGVNTRENAAISIFITLEKPTRNMTEEAVGAGFYHSPGWNKDYPKLQILTIEELLAGNK